MKNKFITMALSVTLLLTNSVTVLADTKEVSGTEVSPVQREACTIEAEIPMEYTVTIPKTITLDSATREATYEVKVTGDVSASSIVTVIPDQEVVLQQNGKGDVTATIKQNDNGWALDEFNTPVNGTITADELTAGSWTGVLNFEIELDKAGLYDASSNLLCTWEESGIAAELDYTEDTYKKAETSAYYVLTKKYKDTVKVIISDDVTSIGNYAFYACTNLTNITIPDSVTIIGESTFRACTNLTGIIIPDGVTSIGNCSFVYCQKLLSVIIPNSVNSIGVQAFLDCDNLTNVIISNGVTYIGEQAFASCASLTNLTIPDSVTSIGELAFQDVPHITYYGTATGSPWGADQVN